jgi:hypothetical protein
MLLLRQTGNLGLVRKAMNHSKLTHALDSDLAAAMEAMTPVAAAPKPFARLDL